MTFRSCAVVRQVLLVTAAVAPWGSCSTSPKSDLDESVTLAAHRYMGGGNGGIVNSALKLQVLTNSCTANQAQQFFSVANNGASPIKVSDVQIKFWVNDTSRSALVASLNTAGCVAKAGNPSCVHPVANTAATITTTSFSPACGPDGSHQANWEVTLSSSDGYAIPVGGTWGNIQAALHLASYASFSPGSSTWYSGCLPGSSYVTNDHFAIYYQGNLVYTSGIHSPICRSPHGTQPLTGHITPAMASAPMVGPVPGTTPISVAIGLQSKTSVQELQDLVQQVSDPTSPSYRGYLTVDGFRDRFGATTDNIQQLQSWAATRGLTVTQTFPNNLLLAVTGTAASIAQAFYVNLNYYRRPDGTLSYGPDREPSVDTTAPLVYVSNLSNWQSPIQAGTPAPPPSTGSGSSNRYLGDDFRNAYARDPNNTQPTDLTGNDQCVGLFSRTGISLADQQTYWTNAGRDPALMPSITAVNATNSATFQPCNLLPTYCTTIDPSTGNPYVCGTGTIVTPSDGMNHCSSSMSPNAACCGVDWVPGKTSSDLTYCLTGCLADNGCDASHMGSSSGNPTGSACSSNHDGGYTEIMSDIEMVMAIAPKASVVVYEGDNTASILTAMATSSQLCAQLSASWNIEKNPIVDIALLEFATQGQSMFHGSGDWGNALWDYGGGSPYITTVGYTNLWTNGPGGTYSTEWPNIDSGAYIEDGNGKDIWEQSVPWTIPIPWYQQGVHSDQASTQYRNVPDVTMVGDDIEADAPFYVAPSAGSSLSGPLWAGFMALINEQNANKGYQPVGFANPALYAIGKTSGNLVDTYQSSFNDVVDYGVVYHDCKNGGSCWRSDDYVFAAGNGYDLASGWGSPKIGLIDRLTSSSPAPVSALSAGGSHVCILQPGGTVSCWGLNNYGQLGKGDTSNSSVPVPVKNLSNISEIASGGYHTCARTSGGTAVYCWGGNDYGQLGLGTSGGSVKTPSQVPGLTNVVHLAAGYQHTCAIVGPEPLSLKCWGRNANGRLGNDSTQDSHSPTSIDTPQPPMQLSLGDAHTCAILSDNTLACWGANSKGQLGIGGTDEQHVPVTVSLLSNAVPTLLATGSEHTCVNMSYFNSDGTWIYCWGDDSAGQLGTLATSDHHLPSPVIAWGNSPQGFRVLAAGGKHTCSVLDSTGSFTLGCWGENTKGQLGIGNTTSPSFGRINTPDHVLAVATCIASTYALRDSGEVYSWGDDQYGQLGDGSNKQQISPVEIIFGRIARH